LGRENGFLGDPSVKIGLPKNFARAEKFLRSVGYGQKIDDLVLAMNRAAETATPKAQELLLESIRKMSISDAKAVLRDIEITKIPFIISSSCTSGMTAYEDKHLGSKRRFYGVVGFDRTSC
jgi:hypothetical protein